MSRYRVYRQRGARPFTAAVLSLGAGLAWLLLRLDSPQWQRVLRHWQQFYPQLANRRPRLGDPLRSLVQTCWLLLVRLPRSARGADLGRGIGWLRRLGRGLFDLVQRVRLPLVQLLRGLPRRIGHSAALGRTQQRIRASGATGQRLFYAAIALIGMFIALLCITSPFNLYAQLVFVLTLWLLAMLMRYMPGRFPTLMLIILSITISCRYLWWRYTSTLNWTNNLDLILGLTLLLAETYSWLVLILSFVQSVWPLRRPVAPLPDDRRQWPSVDLVIPTYNEDLSVIRTTVMAALGLDWPQDKLKVYILDDGAREAFREFAEEVGVGYIDRHDNRGAKAGNLNHALQQLNSELVAVFDCDHIPVRAFLQMTVGWFLRDPQMALVQTPHHFFSADPFEHNLGSFRRKPNEGELFYGLIQDGNDLWNAAFFCGSCAVLRRSALDDIGGFATQTVTEDAHTALRLHRAGWNSAYIRIPLAAGLATDSLAAHVRQRIRWARGMVQIFRMDNPLLGKGLSLFQRLCYANAMLHFLSGLPRLVFLTAPLAFLLLHAYVIYAPAVLLLLYVLPHMIHASLVNSRVQGPYRQTFWGEVYESVLAWYIMRPTLVALFSLRRGAFDVTVKGGMSESDHLDWRIARPYLVLAGLNLVGLGFAVWRFFYGPSNEYGTVVVSSLWVIYNLLLIGSALAVAAEVRQVRRFQRVPVQLPAALRLADGHLYPGVLNDYSDGGAGVQLVTERDLPADTEVMVLLQRAGREFVFPGKVMRTVGRQVGISLVGMSLQQRIDYVQCTFARADNWLGWSDSHVPDRPLRSFVDVLALGITGYYRVIEFAPAWLRTPVLPLIRLVRWLLSFFPRMPRPIPLEPMKSTT
ncbi:UDP-forming cellulose synthase catalytic subunit [Aquipseudomonas alcaligenes]|uniref:UDP-forming cellulose synthase catalytic subunit n=1 Tax=Aquipseudomonas alcaligenes TaxID=43263 RepID=UPI003749FE89